MRLLRKFRPPVQKWTTTVEGACLRPRSCRRTLARGFEETWKSFLGLLFVPKFRKLLKAKKQGAGRTTLDGRLF